MYQKKTLFNKMIHGLLAVVMTFTSFSGYAQTTSAQDQFNQIAENGIAPRAAALFPDNPDCERVLFPHEEPANGESGLSTHDVGTMLTSVFGGTADNAALAFYHAESYVPKTQFTNCDPKLADNQWVGGLFGQHEKVMNGQSMSELIKNAPTADKIAQNFKDARGATAKRSKAYQVIAQDFVNMAYLYGPRLKQLVEAEEYDQAFRYAHEKRMMRLIILMENC